MEGSRKAANEFMRCMYIVQQAFVVCQQRNTSLLHEAADALLQNEGFRAAEQAAEAGMASILLPSTIH